MTSQDPGSAFESLVGDMDYPMFVVTGSAAGERSGCLVGFVTQCSISPQRLLVCLSKKNHTYDVAADADRLVVHFLGETDRDLARLFGAETGDEVDKFARCEWDAGPGDTPVLRGCRGWVAGLIVERVDLGDHVGMVLDVTDGEARRPSARPLGFQSLAELDPGHEA